MNINELPRLGDLRQHLAHEGLASEAGLNRHDQNHVAQLDEGCDGCERCTGIDDQPEVETRVGSPFGHGCGVGYGLDMDGDQVGAGFRQCFQVGRWVADHEMAIQGELRRFPQRSDDRYPERDVRNEVAVHNVDVEHVHVVLNAGHLCTEFGEVGGEY